MSNNNLLENYLNFPPQQTGIPKIPNVKIPCERGLAHSVKLRIEYSCHSANTG